MEPFSIAVPEAAIEDLRSRLRKTRFGTPTLPPGDWSAGLPVDYLRELVDYWLNDFDWRAVEAELNMAPQFTAEIRGRRLHFAWLRADPARFATVIPIVLGHGWPYSFAEMLPLARQLAAPTDGDIAFDVVVPSLPGFLFSEVDPVEPVIAASVAEGWHELMTTELGYDRYLTYGEDVAAAASDWLAATRPESVLGIVAAHPAFATEERKGRLSAEEVAWEAFHEWVMEGGRGYSIQQSSRPDTLAAALTDSPAGLASWIIEKFQAWSDCAGVIEARFTKGQLLTTVSLYWFSASISTSFRPYFDDRHERALPLVRVPAAIAIQQHERGMPRSMSERTYMDIRSFTNLDRGGHFTAFEEPELVADIIRVHAIEVLTVSSAPEAPAESAV